MFAAHMLCHIHGHDANEQAGLELHRVGIYLRAWPVNYCGVVSLVRTKRVLRPPRVSMAARCWFGVVIAVALGGDLHQRSISL
jgi:hypothetical protein